MFDPTPFARRATPALVGVIHLLPLPGSPSARLRLHEVVVRALSEARALVEGAAGRTR